MNNAATGSICNGTGTCIASSGAVDAGAGQPCAPYVCKVGAGCPASCASDTDCVSGFFCSGGACTAKSNGACNAVSSCGNFACERGRPADARLSWLGTLGLAFAGRFRRTRKTRRSRGAR